MLGRILWLCETYIIIGLFITVLKADLVQSYRRPRLDCVHGQIPFDRAVCAVPALRRALPEIIMYRRRSVNIDDQREHYHAGRDPDQLQRAQRLR